MKTSNEISEKIILYCETSENLLKMFKHEFNKEEFLGHIWQWAPWIKTMKDCRTYHAHIIFRLLQKELCENPKFEIGKEAIHAYLEEVFNKEYPDLDLETGRILEKK